VSLVGARESRWRGRGATADDAIVELKELHNRARVFRDRGHAGVVLAELLAPRCADRPKAVVLAIPAGGVPVAAPVAERLALPLDLAVVSKITPPWNSEIGYGAVAFDGAVLLNEPLVRRLGLSPAQVADGVARTRAKVARRNVVLRGGRDSPALANAEAILVDDGLASGFTMRAAIAAVRAAGAAVIVVAVPTAHESSVRALAREVDAVYCANVRGGPGFAVADAYEVWSDVDEQTVRSILLATPSRGG
jgi:putative phosphoribosyl transferase